MSMESARDDYFASVDETSLDEAFAAGWEAATVVGSSPEGQKDA